MSKLSTVDSTAPSRGNDEKFYYFVGGIFHFIGFAEIFNWKICISHSALGIRHRKCHISQFTERKLKRLDDFEVSAITRARILSNHQQAYAGAGARGYGEWFGVEVSLNYSVVFVAKRENKMINYSVVSSLPFRLFVVFAVCVSVRFWMEYAIRDKVTLYLAKLN